MNTVNEKQVCRIIEFTVAYDNKMKQKEKIQTRIEIFPEHCYIGRTKGEQNTTE